MPVDPTEGDPKWLRQQCVNCGNSRQSHRAGEPEFCPTNEGSGKWDETMRWVPGSRFMTDEEIAANKERQ